MGAGMDTVSVCPELSVTRLSRVDSGFPVKEMRTVAPGMGMYPREEVTLILRVPLDSGSAPPAAGVLTCSLIDVGIIRTQLRLQLPFLGFSLEYAVIQILLRKGIDKIQILAYICIV